MVKGVLRHSFIHQCVVVDDGSNDKTMEYATSAGAYVIRHSNNKGAGAAITTGLRHAVKHKANVVLFMDADGQHDPRHIPELIQALGGGVDMVIGSRYIQQTTDSTSFVRKIGSGIISFCISLCYYKKVYDPTSGFRALNKRTTALLAKRYPTIFPEPEAVIRIIKKGYTLKEISVEMKPRMYGKSSISLLRGGFLMLFICFIALYYRFVRYPSPNTMRVLHQQ